MSHVGTTLVRKLAEYFERKHGDLDVNYPALIRSRLLLFVNSQIENPAFDSQMKDALIRFVDTRDSFFFFGGGGLFAFMHCYGVLFASRCLRCAA